VVLAILFAIKPPSVANSFFSFSFCHALPLSLSHHLESHCTIVRCSAVTLIHCNAHTPSITRSTSYPADKTDLHFSVYHI